jgi:hypothetical protein
MARLVRAFPFSRVEMSTTAQQSIEATIAAAASKTTYGGATTSVVGWLLSSEFGMVAGLLIAIAGLGTNWWFQRKRDRREQAEHERRMKGKK